METEADSGSSSDYNCIFFRILFPGRQEILKQILVLTMLGMLWSIKRKAKKPLLLLFLLYAFIVHFLLFFFSFSFVVSFLLSVKLSTRTNRKWRKEKRERSENEGKRNLNEGEWVSDTEETEWETPRSWLTRRSFPHDTSYSFFFFFSRLLLLHWFTSSSNGFSFSSSPDVRIRVWHENHDEREKPGCKHTL